MDEEVKTLTRETYTITDVFSSTGGFMEIVGIFFGLLVTRIQAKLYYRSLA